MMQTQVRELGEMCVEGMAVGAEIRVKHAVETMFFLLCGLLMKAENHVEMKLMLAGEEGFEFFCEKFLSSLLPLVSSNYSAGIRLWAVKCLFVVCFSGNAIHHSTFFPADMHPIHVRSSSLLCLFLDLLDSSVAIKTLSLMNLVTCCHYQQYDGSSAFIKVWIECETKELEILDQAVAEVMQYSLQQESCEESVLEFSQKLFSNAVSLAFDWLNAGAVINTRSSKITEAGNENVTELRAYLLMLTAALTLYNCLYHQRKFITCTAKFKRIESHVVPTRVPLAIVAFLMLSSKVFQESTSKPAHAQLLRLCLLIFQLMSQDIASCVLLHDCSMLESTPIISIFSKPRKMWRSFSKVPLFSIVILLLSELISSQLSKLFVCDPICLPSVKLALEIVSRIVTYHHEIFSSNKPLLRYLVSSYLLIMRVCAKTIRRFVTQEVYEARHLVFLLQALKVISLVLTCANRWLVDHELPEAESECLHQNHVDVASILYELVRVSESLHDCLIKFRAVKDSNEIVGRVLEEMRPLYDLANHLNHLLSDVLAAKKFVHVSSESSTMQSIFNSAQHSFSKNNPLTVEQAIDSIAAALDTFRIPTTPISSRFVPYVENPHEISFFNTLLHGLITGCKQLICHSPFSFP